MVGGALELAVIRLFQVLMRFDLDMMWLDQEVGVMFHYHDWHNVQSYCRMIIELFIVIEYFR